MGLRLDIHKSVTAEAANNFSRNDSGFLHDAGMTLSCVISLFASAWLNATQGPLSMSVCAFCFGPKASSFFARGSLHSRKFAFKTWAEAREVEASSSGSGPDLVDINARFHKRGLS